MFPFWGIVLDVLADVVERTFAADDVVVVVALPVAKAQQLAGMDDPLGAIERQVFADVRQIAGGGFGAVGQGVGAQHGAHGQQFAVPCGYRGSIWLGKIPGAQ